MKIKCDTKLIKGIAKDRGLTITNKEAKEAHLVIMDEIEDAEEYYYMMKDYFNN